MPKRRNEQAPYWQQLRVAERGIIEYALEHGKTIRGTAVILGISPNYLGERLRLLGIPVPDVRPGPKPGTPRRPATPKLRVVDGPPPPAPDETLDEDEDEDTEGGAAPNDDVLEDEAEEGQDDDEEGDPWDDANEDDEDEGNSGGESGDASAQGN